MNIEDAVYNILKVDAGVFALVGTNIFPVVGKQGVGDYIVFQTISDSPYDTKEAASTFNKPRIQVVAWSQNHKTSKQIGNAIEDALDRYSGTVQGVNVDSIQYITRGDMYDEDSHTFGKRSEYYLIIKQ